MIIYKNGEKQFLSSFFLIIFLGYAESQDAKICNI